ncbi:FeoC-like transcriptional regulator [Methanothermococcus thermolithotrophicus]|uniref:FeoC-like transcriptional regulator n=1 Tax=Methanothermococcus thermolithotrophicus TaxID=2186 RepID=UPI00037A3E95|nr:FeoC-like transcriptional regulator [Methanothermococcus thermolithotrophicus]
MESLSINNLPNDTENITKLLSERKEFLKRLPLHISMHYFGEGGTIPEDKTIHFDLKESCSIMGVSYELLKEIYCKDTYGKLQLWQDIYDALTTKLKIELVHPELKDINNIDLSNEDEQTQKLYNRIMDNIENTIFKEETGDYDLNLEKIRNVYSIYKTFIKDNGSENIKYIAVFPKPKIENIEYFDGHRYTKKKLLKMRGEVIDMYDEDCFFNFIQLAKNGNINIGNYIKEFNGIYNYVVKRFDNTSTIRKTESWGYFGEGKAIFKGWDINITGEKAKRFEELLNTEYKEEELKELAQKLNEYVKNEEFSKIILEWSLASIFRYSLMDERRLDKFPYLLIKGKQGIGKTARINILFSKFLLNTTTAYSVDDVKGSIAKLAKEQYINLPMWFDELKIFPDRLVDMLKQLGTNKEYLMTRGNKNVEKEDYRFYLRRPFLISTNQFTIDDPALLDRFIVLYAEDYELIDNAKIGKEIFNNIHKLGAWIYDNIEEIKKEVIDKLEFEADRELANETVLYIGRELAKHIFSKFGVEYTPSTRVIYGNDSVVTSKDSIRHKIIEKTIKLSEYVKDGIRYNILDYFVDPAEYNTVEKILAKYGIFPYTDKIGNNYIAITKTGILHMDLKEEGIKKLSELDAHGFKTTVIRKEKTHRVALIPIDEEVKEEDTELADIILDTIGGNTVHEAEIIAIIHKEHNIDGEKIRKTLKNMEGNSLRKVGKYKYAKMSGNNIKERIKKYIENKGKVTINEICIKFDIEDEEAEKILGELCLKGEISKINNTTYIH